MSKLGEIWDANLAAMKAAKSFLLPPLLDWEAAGEVLPPPRGRDGFNASEYTEELQKAAGKLVLLADPLDGDLVFEAMAADVSGVVCLYDDFLGLIDLLGRWPFEEELRRGVLSFIYIPSLDPEIFRKLYALLGSQAKENSFLVPASTESQEWVTGTSTPSLDSLLYLLLSALFPRELSSGPYTQLRRYRNALRRIKPLGEVEAIKIVTFVAHGTQVLESIVDRYHAAFRELGCECIKIVEAESGVTNFSRLKILADEQPDLMFAAVFWPAAVMGFYSWFLDMPSVTLLNNPLLTLTKQKIAREYPPTESDLLYSWDRESADWSEDFLSLPDRIGVQMIATTYDTFEDLPSEDETREPVIAFIGSIHEEVKGELTALKDRDWRILEEAFWKTCNNKGMGSIEDFLAEAGKKLSLPVKTDPQHIWATVYRISILEALNGLPIVIYGGKNWPEVLKRRRIKAEYRGFLDQENELPHVMSRMQINLNACTAHTSAANMRTYDAAGLGSCVLQDAKPEATANFIEDEEMVFFRSRMDLRKKAEALLADPERCKAIGAAARAKVLEHHTYKARAERFLKDVREKLADKKTEIDLSLFGQ